MVKKIKVDKLTKENINKFQDGIQLAKEEMFKLLWAAYENGKLNLVVGDVHFKNNIDDDDDDVVEDDDLTDEDETPNKKIKK